MRNIIYINENWEYFNYFKNEMITQYNYSTNMEIVNLPHTNILLPLNYFDEDMYKFKSCYRYKLKYNVIEGRKTFINFEGMMTNGKLYINGSYVEENLYGYTDFKVEITDLLISGDNLIVLELDSSEREDIPPFGGMIDYLTYGGIFREVELIETNDIYIKDIFIYANDPIKLKDVVAKITLSENVFNQKIVVEIYDGNILIDSISKIITGDEVILEKTDVNYILWNLDNPKLYDILIKLDGIDELNIKTGFRKIEFTKEGFFLNERKIVLFGLNRHQSYPFIGYGATKNAQVIDADILKNELGLNFVRTSHYPQSRHFLDRCDEIGLLVFEEIPGWQHLGDEIWKERVVSYVGKMIKRDKNHPSIIIWGVRVNESDDCHDLYAKTNDLARSMDKTRKTAGVRFKYHQEFLEDVYSINDFIFNGSNTPLSQTREVTNLDKDVPYMISEFIGHTYPTKKIDNEERLLEHALRHAKVFNNIYGDKFKHGGSGWCAFDYNTHRQFGSGDKICYHGVMDIFRLPKMAAYFYKSQKNPIDEIVLEPSTIWAFGERCVGGVVPLYIFTNCDFVEMLIEGKEKVIIDERATDFLNLKNPPLILKTMDNVWGANWKDVEFIGYIDNKKVINKRFLSSPTPYDIVLYSYNEKIVCNDMTRIVVKVVDKVENVLRFYNEPIKISIENGINCGPSNVSLYGGEYSFLVRSVKKGKMKIEVDIINFFKKTIVIEVI